MATRSTRMRRGVIVTSAALLACTSFGIGAVAAGSYPGGPLLNRAATGDLEEFGGATRLGGDQNKIIKDAIKASRAKNVILLIGDGMGDSEITVARNYSRGAGGAYPGIDALPITGNMTTYSLLKDGRPDYVPDSAATGSAWSTGTKTYDNAISVGIDGAPHQTLLQRAKATGRATGDITTAEIQDATPAVEVANISQRRCYGPTETTASCPEAAKENGGKGSISEQLLDTRPDLTLGGGSATFAQTAKAGRWAGLTLEQQARNRGYTYFTAKNDLDALTAVSQTKPAIGLFSAGNMPVRYAPLVATATGGTAPAARCQTNPDNAAVPTLKAMTQKSIKLLAANPNGAKNGFFLQVESASIDKRDHAADVCGQIGETDQLDEAVQAALSYARQDGHTLVIVTADHAHTSQIVDSPTPGLNARLLTNEGSEMLVAYNTSPAGGSQQHTGTQLRVAAYGPGAANLSGLVDETDLFFVMRNGMTAWDTCQAKKKSTC